MIYPAAQRRNLVKKCMAILWQINSVATQFLLCPFLCLVSPRIDKCFIGELLLLPLGNLNVLLQRIEKTHTNSYRLKSISEKYLLSIIKTNTVYEN